LFGKELKTIEAELIDYALFEAEDGFYFIKKEKDKKVKGFILEIDDYDLKICDTFEECPIMYQRRTTKVVCEAKMIDAYVYIRVDDVGSFKYVENYDSFSKLSEDELIKTEIKEFKSKEHPEIYLK